MAKKIMAVRYDKKDMAKIKEFLTKNPFLDFSTLNRMAVIQFIENPSIQIKGVSNEKPSIPS